MKIVTPITRLSFGKHTGIIRESCTECGCQHDYVIEVGEADDDGCGSANLCAGCLQQALSMLQSANIPPSEWMTIDPDQQQADILAENAKHQKWHKSEKGEFMTDDRYPGMEWHMHRSPFVELAGAQPLAYVSKTSIGGAEAQPPQSEPT